MMRIIPLVWGKEKKGYIFSDAAIVKSISICFMNAFAFIHMTVNEAVHVIAH